MPSRGAPTRSTGRRRSSDDVRAQLLAAARDLFGTQGYGVKTKEIADRAGTAESVLFRNFGSKADLFVAAVAAPFSNYVTQYVAAWERHPPSTTAEELVEDFVSGLFDLARSNRPLLLSMVAARAEGGDPLERISSQIGRELANAFAKMYRVLIEESRAQGYEGMDPPVTIAAVVSMVLGMVLLDDWVFPPSRPPSRTRQEREVTTMVLHGIAHRSPDV